MAKKSEYWLVRGEGGGGMFDPPGPILCVAKGPKAMVEEYAKTLPNWFNWGGGETVTPIDFVDVTDSVEMAARVATRDRMNRIDRQIDQLKREREELANFVKP